MAKLSNALNDTAKITIAIIQNAIVPFYNSSFDTLRKISSREIFPRKIRNNCPYFSATISKKIYVRKLIFAILGGNATRVISYRETSSGMLKNISLRNSRRILRRRQSMKIPKFH